MPRGSSYSYHTSSDASQPFGASGFSDEAQPLDSAPRALSVSQALQVVNRTLNGVSLRIIGEVSEVNAKRGYKAVYFTIKDEKGVLNCLMWNNRYVASGVSLTAGALVEVQGRFSCYAQTGRMSFDVSQLNLAGEGNLRLRVANLAKKLQAEGLMSEQRKRPIPLFPARVGVVTSPRGAAVHDVRRTLAQRFPLTTMVFAGVPVEGSDAPAHLIEAMRCVCSANIDVLLLVRGGGSYDDLMPFNDEMLAREIFSCPVPVVTGIGHEPDTSIADMVADKRAATPTAAAEAVTPLKEELYAGFADALNRLHHLSQVSLARFATQFDKFASRPIFQAPEELFKTEFQNLDAALFSLTSAFPHTLRQQSDSLDLLRERLKTAIPSGLDLDSKELTRCQALLLSGVRSYMQAARQRCELGVQALHKAACSVVQHEEHACALQASRLDDLSPLKVIARGYSITRLSTGALVKSCKQVMPHDSVNITLSDGVVACNVTDILPADASKTHTAS